MAARQKRRNPSDMSLSHFLLHSAATNSRPNIADWIRGLGAPSDSTDPAAPPTPPAKRREVDSNPQSRYHQCLRDEHTNALLMSGSSRKQKVQKTSAIRDDDNFPTRGRTRKSGRARGRVVVSMREQMAAVPEDDTNTPPLTEGPASASVASEYDAISEAPSFPLPTVTSLRERSSTRSSSPKKKTVTKREDLALLNPTIEFKGFDEAENCGIELPQSVKELWYRCDARRSATPGMSPPIPLTSRDLMQIEDTLKDAFEMANIWRSTTTEPHWMSAVVGPILHLIRKLSIFHDKDKNSNENVTVMDITSIDISPSHLCPYSNTSLYLDLDKRIDYAIGLFPSRSTLRTLRNATYNTAIKSVNQTSTFCNFIPVFINVEIKKKHVGKDPAIQLGAWIAAEFRKRLIEGWTGIEADDTRGRGSLSLGSPVFAIEIEADTWLLYVVTAQLKPLKSCKPSKNVTKENYEIDTTDQDFEMFFFGPMRLGDTYSMDDTKRLVENLCDISLWGQTEFKKWWEETILAACEE
ncbi:hypothetical protein GP486_006857 [Trichoglossum hirsutum]|uniref:PD-(D/E)XK nuclease-like domain-containing protein n=1 Tax=Trichoglossum hirsutum TaxID=265104 RepID=A0A9P8IDS4_9PEZI|nr:hypothetical protein GP486_006857 [Trichoglossum hirsutum]